MKVQIIELEGNKLAEAEKRLAGIEGGASKAIKAAMQDSTRHLQTMSSREIRKRYAIRHKDIRAEQNVKKKFTYTPGVGVHSEIIFSGNAIPLIRFQGTTPQKHTKNVSAGRRWVYAYGKWNRFFPSKVSKGRQLKDHPAKALYSNESKYSDAFTATMTAGDGVSTHTGIFERIRGSKRADGGEKIKELMGSSVAQMLNNQEVRTSLEAETSKQFNKELDHEITRILNGWGV